MPQGPLVSIITAVYNGERYIAEAIQSVIDQDYENWELLLINDGSSDGTHDIIQTFLKDQRIRYFRLARNSGVSAARNLALSEMTGDWFGFLDADDALTSNSLSSRVAYQDTNHNVTFIDGCVFICGAELLEITQTWSPNFQGNPLHNLLLNPEVCFNQGSWLIRRDYFRHGFQDGLTHGEDLLFLIDNVADGEYGYVNDAILKMRRGHGSVMSDLHGLETGYLALYKSVKEKQTQLSDEELLKLKKRYRRVMFRSYLKSYKLAAAVRVFLKFSKL